MLIDPVQMKRPTGPDRKKVLDRGKETIPCADEKWDLLTANPMKARLQIL